MKVLTRLSTNYRTKMYRYSREQDAYGRCCTIIPITTATRKLVPSVVCQMVPRHRTQGVEDILHIEMATVYLASPDNSPFLRTRPMLYHFMEETS